MPISHQPVMRRNALHHTVRATVVNTLRSRKGSRLISKLCLWLDPKRVDTLIFLCKNMLQADLSSNYHLLVGPSV